MEFLTLGNREDIREEMEQNETLLLLSQAFKSGDRGVPGGSPRASGGLTVLPLKSRPDREGLIPGAANESQTGAMGSSDIGLRVRNWGSTDRCPR